GRVVWMGQALGELPKGAWRALRRDLQIIFQDPLGSLDPRMTVGEIVGEPLRVHAPDLDRGARAAQLAAVLRRVGLSAELASRYPHELSGGQCQRVGIDRKSTRLNSSHSQISYAVFCLKKKSTPRHA